MSSAQASTAILVFTRTAKEEAHQKLFVRSENAVINISISAHFISRTIREVRKSGIPYFIVSSERQHGDSFGERLTNAFAQIFDLGFEKVIAVGNDSPQLNASLLKVAADSLIKNDLVLGPDRRGGTYLIGTTKNYFDADAFRRFSWKTPNLFSDLVSWSEHVGCRLELLQELVDVNTIADFNLLLRNKNISSSFLHRLHSVLASILNSTADRIVPFYFSPYRLAEHFRGPPEL